MSPHSSFECDEEKLDAVEQAFDGAWAWTGLELRFAKIPTLVCA
jgi:hypothetical protein